MKKFKKAAIVVSILVILILVNEHFNLVQSIIIQFSKEKYISYVANIDYEKELSDEPISIIDKASDDKELAETELSRIIAPHKLHIELEKEYSLNSVATADTDLERTVQILSWLTEHTFYSGAQMKLLTDNPLDILKYSFNKPFKRAINCRYKAIVFADCLVAVGINAIPVCMQSAEFNGCHFTCMVYISEIDKWCSFDPSFGCWFSDDKGQYVGIFEIRDMFINGLEPVVHGYNFNGTEECFDAYINGFMKYCISNLSTWADNSTDKRDESNFSGRKQFVSKIPEEII